MERVGDGEVFVQSAPGKFHFYDEVGREGMKRELWTHLGNILCLLEGEEEPGEMT